MKAPDEYLAMYIAHESGDIVAVRRLIDAHPELQDMGPDDDTVTWLHVAAEKGHISLAAFWLERGFDVDSNLRGASQRNDGLTTPLHFAEDAAMTRFLLSRGASVNAYGRPGGTPLHNAITRAVEPARQRQASGANMDQIRALLDAGADLSMLNGEGKGYTPLAWAIHLRRRTAEQVLRDVGAPETGRRPIASRRKVKKLDLRRESKAIYEHLMERVRTFDPQGRNVLGEPGPIKMIELGFEYSQKGWLVVVFDLRPDAAPDGEWTRRIEGNELDRTHWLQSGEAAGEAPIPIVQLDGTETELAPGTELAEILGPMVKTAVLKARADGVFTGLPLATGCELGVEHFDGAYGWPAYEDRGRENIAAPDTPAGGGS